MKNAVAMDTSTVLMAIPCICLLFAGSLINLYAFIKSLDGMKLAIVTIASVASWIIGLFQYGIIYGLLFSCLHQYVGDCKQLLGQIDKPVEEFQRLWATYEEMKAKFEWVLFALFSSVQIVIVLALYVFLDGKFLF